MAVEEELKMAVHVVEDELIRSNARRAFIVGYLMGIADDAIHQLDSTQESEAERLRARLEEVYPLIEKEFYGVVVKRTDRAPEQTNELHREGTPRTS